jgi:hypothetical protein
MAVTIDEIEIELPSAESTPPAAAAPAGAGAASWNAALAQRLAEELRIAAERAARIVAD